MKQTTKRLPERKLGDLLNETFAVYGRSFRNIVILLAVIQVPVSVVAQLLGESIPSLVIVGIVSAMGNGLVYGAVAYATGQSYFDNGISVKRCYQRVGWRLLSILLLSLVPSAVLGAILGLAGIESDLTVFLIFPALGLLIYLIYWSIAVPSIIFEGHKAVEALKRSYILIKGHWWRVFGINMVFGLVALGLVIIVSIPFAIASRIAMGEGEEANLASMTMDLLAAAATSVLVLPVIFIAGTLLYYDLRVRKEGFNTDRLSQEMGIVQV